MLRYFYFIIHLLAFEPDSWLFCLFLSLSLLWCVFVGSVVYIYIGNMVKFLSSWSHSDVLSVWRILTLS